MEVLTTKMSKASELFKVLTNLKESFHDVLWAYADVS
jgi:hypothetical protein